MSETPGHASTAATGQPPAYPYPYPYPYPGQVAQLPNRPPYWVPAAPRPPRPYPATGRSAS